jgi:outer membrane protein assembly factor BamB
MVETLALDRKDGRILWMRNLGREGTPTPTPVTDGKSVYVFFGSIGLIAYDLDGQEQWRQPIALIMGFQSNSLLELTLTWLIIHS